MSLEELLQEIRDRLEQLRVQGCYNLPPDEQRELADLLREASDLLCEDLELQQA